MIKIVSFCFLAFLCFKLTSAYSQSSYKEYIGKTLYAHPSGKLVTGFFKSPRFAVDTGNIPYPVVTPGNRIVHSNSDSLINKPFKCVGVVEIMNITYLKLENKQTGFLYYAKSFDEDGLITEEGIKTEKDVQVTKEKILSDTETEFDKKVKEYKDHLNNPCLDIDENYDTFHCITKFETGYIKPEYPKKLDEYPTAPQYFDVIFHKEKTKIGITYYVNITGHSSTPLAMEKGVIVILKNKKRLNKPLALVKTNVNTSGDNGESFIRSSFIKLTAQDIALLKSSPIDEFELYDTQVKENDSDTLYKAFLCLTNK